MRHCAAVIRSGRALVPLLFLTGCLTAAPTFPMRYYALEVAPSVETYPPLEKTLGIRDLLPARPYRLPMAYLTAEGLVQYRQNEQWAEMPEVVVTRALKDALVQTGRFADVGDAAEMKRPDLILTGDLRKFYEDRRGDTPLALVEVRLELREAQGTQALWAKTLTTTVPLPDSSAATRVKGFETAVGQLVSTAAREIAGAVN